MFSRLAVALVLSCAIAAQEADVSIRIREQSVIATQRATLADVAVLGGDTAVTSRLAKIQVADLPDLVPVRIDPKLITALTTRAAGASTLRIDGSGTVARQPRVWSPDDMAAIAAATLGPSSTWKLVRSSGSLTAPDSPTLRVIAEAIDVNAIGDVPFRIRAMEGDAERARALIVLNVERRGQIMVTTHDLHRGDVVSATDLRREMRAVDRSNQGALDLDPAAMIGRVLRRDLGAGQPVPVDALALPPAVRAGANVTAVWPGDGFAIEMTVTALSDTRNGERLTVRRMSDGAILHAIAHGDGTVSIVR